jgi:hypothetical protein
VAHRAAAPIRPLNCQETSRFLALCPLLNLGCNSRKSSEVRVVNMHDKMASQAVAWLAWSYESATEVWMRSSGRHRRTPARLTIASGVGPRTWYRSR